MARARQLNGNRMDDIARHPPLVKDSNPVNLAA
jgi:hypothetical protein